MSSSKEPAKNEKYKGGSFPAPIIPASGLGIGIVVPKLLLRLESLIPLAWSALSPQESLMIVLQAFGLLSPMFISEFLLGVQARSSSPEASFNPAGAAASGTHPFAVVQANRIFQNHIESAFMFVPAALAATAAGANPRMIVACIATWVGSRCLYRIGYCSPNPFWRICGVTTAQFQTFTCLYLFSKTKM